MERLTTRNIAGVAVYKNPFECERCGETIWRLPDYGNGSPTEKLAAYVRLIYHQKLPFLQCKVGDTVYVVTSPFNVFDDIEYDENMKDEVYEAYVSSVSFYESGEQYRIYAKVTNHFIGVYFRECDFGKIVFLTKNEAEAKLAEMEGAE